ncbi:MAG TPA: metalloregulator ArsR/SmtB family transcription factor [Ktedonobacterales bacterium]|nr:metalloregulator ArsR/SmtB family transcription factor [Ktedonobacterales bacterium]
MKTIARDMTTYLPHQASNEQSGVCCPAPSLLPSASEVDDTRIVALTDRLKALADETRLRMLDLLIQHGESLCVCEITEQFDLRQPTISHHLRLLREARLIRGEKRGTWTYYSATDEGTRCMALARSLV